MRADFDGNDGAVGDELRGPWRVLGIKVLEPGGFPGAVNADEPGYHREILFLKILWLDAAYYILISNNWFLAVIARSFYG